MGMRATWWAGKCTASAGCAKQAKVCDPLQLAVVCLFKRAPALYFNRHAVSTTAASIQERRPSGCQAGVHAQLSFDSEVYSRVGTKVGKEEGQGTARGGAP